MENEPQGDISPSDVKDLAANNNTKQLCTVPKWYREGKQQDSQRGFIHFHPIYYLKGDRALGNSILRNSSSGYQNQEQHSFKARSNTDWNSSQMVSLKSSLWKWPSSTIFKNDDPGPFYHYFFLLSSEHSHFDYLNIFTGTSAVIGYPLRRYILTRLELAEAKYASMRT